jgi:hypothetical protein
MLNTFEIFYYQRFSPSRSVFPKLFELADHKPLHNTLADQKILKTNSADHEIEI